MHDFTIPIGPQHPSLKESVCLRLKLKGNYIQEANLRAGYLHRGMEKIMEGRDFDSGLYAIEHICGICSFAHSGCYTQAIERIADVEVPEKVKLLRVLIAELERIHSHLLWAGYMGHEIGLETLFMYFWREREKILDIFEKVTGGRVHHAYNKLGSVRYDLSAGDDAFILGKLASVEKKTRDYLEEIRTERIIRARLSGVGTITKEEAKRWSLVGPVARGSGVENDVREYAPYEAYDCVDFGQVVADDGDAMARATVRLGEILQSCDIARQVLGQVKDKKMPKLCAIPEIKDGEGFGRVEAPRGENFHFYRITGGRIERAKVRTPTLANIFIVEKLLEGCEVGDVPVMISSLDPCFGCMDRVMVVRGEACSVLREKEFRRKFGCSP